MKWRVIELIVKKMSEDYSVADQLVESDLAGLKVAGFKSIMCNRPDDEEDDQTDYQIIEEAARALGFKTSFTPIESGRVQEDEMRAFSIAVDQLPKPILAYCRSGMRCTVAWAMDQASRGATIASLVNIAQSAGYDLTALQSHIESSAKQTTGVS